MSQRFQKNTPATKGKGVRFFDQFLKNFVRPYGATKEAPTDETTLTRIQPFNCELLSRPRIGMSELSASITDPLQAILESPSKLVHVSHVKKLQKKLKGLTDSLETFNTKREEGESSKEVTKEPSQKDVKDVLRFFLKEEDDMQEAVSEAFVLGSNLMTLSTNYIVARALFTNPDEYAHKSNIDGEEGKKFKKLGSVKALKELLNKTCLNESMLEKKELKKKKHLYLELDSTDEEEENKVEKRKKEKKRKRVVEEKDEEEEQAEVEEEVVEREKGSSKRKKSSKQCGEEEVEEEEEEEGEEEEEIVVQKKKAKKDKKRSKRVLEEEDEED